MRFVNAGGRSALLVGDQVFDLEGLSGGALSPDPMTVIRDQWPQAVAAHDRGGFDGGVPVDGVRLGPPVPRPRSAFGIGRNYREHAHETGSEVPDQPVVFAKFASCLVGPHDDVVLPRGKATVDWEAELVVVLAGGARHVEPADAWDHVLGFTCGQDISERTTQRALGGQFSLGKSFDTFGPTGPAVVTLDELDDRSRLHLTCSIGEERMQDAHTDELIFDIPTLVAFLTSILTPARGDLCFTGTPAGVGVARGRFLGPGDVISTSIEGVGTMRNRCVAEPA